MREELVKVFDDTMAYIKENKSLSSALSQSKKSTVVQKGINLSNSFSANSGLKNVKITRNRTFEAAIKLRSQYPTSKIAVLNFASATTPGGGVKRGASAQEEALCRCSTLYPCLVQEKIFNEFYKVNRESKNPLHTDDLIYTNDIIICKDDRTLKRLPEDKFVTVDVITCAAPNLRENPSNQYNVNDGDSVQISDEELYKIHFSRAKNIIASAIKNNVKILVLGAFGCGAFRNNPSVVAEAYRDVLEMSIYNQFDRVEFAIYGSDTNFKAFDDVFSC